MNESKNTEPSKSCNWLIIRNAAFYGCVLSALISIGAIYYGGIFGLLFLGLPLERLFEMFGIDPMKKLDSSWYLFVILSYALFFFFVGIAIELLVRFVRNKTRK